MKVQSCVVSIASLFLAACAFAQTPYLTTEALIKEFDREVKYDTNSGIKIVHRTDRKVEMSGQDSRGRPVDDTGSFELKDGKYCTKWVRTRNGAESCFSVSLQDAGKLVFYSADGKETGWRREMK
jgi:hypothetical protein